ncbi:MAG: Xaa-Pro dipeptidase [Pseudomonadales bacterium]|nr:Xaa-Pro dipeptidase [Pseudomonadales bacterium]
MRTETTAEILSPGPPPTRDEWTTLFSAHLEQLMLRTTTVLENAAFSGLLLHSGTEHYVFRDDFTYPFKVHATFKQWAPISAVPDCFVYVDPDRDRPLLIFHQPQDFWHRAAPVPDTYWSDSFEIRVATDRASARGHLPHDLSRVAFIGEAFPELTTFGVGSVNPQYLLAALDYPRARKSPYELACLREANRLGALGHQAAAVAFAAGASEFEIALAFMGATGQREKELPYNPIIALNEAGSVLHYQMQQTQRPSVRHSFLIDAGCEFAGYASDITRTYSYSDPDFRALIGAFDDLQQALCGEVRAGVDWPDIHQRSHVAIAGWLRDAGLVRTDPQETVDSGLSAVFYPHGIGHLLGLQVHDAGGTLGGPDGHEIPRPPRHPTLRLTRRLEAGFVVTMEPGVYFIRQLLDQARASPLGKHIEWSRVAQLERFGGIRIEDDLAVTDAGCENLTRAAFSTTIAPGA